MTNKLHAEWLREGVKKWNYRRKKVAFQPDLAGLKFFEYLPRDFRDQPKTSRFFEGIDLSGADLSGADLSDLNFANANFSNSSLAAADMSMSNFTNTVFTNANLTEAHVRMSFFGGGYFENTELKGTDFEEASIDGAVFVDMEVEQIRDARVDFERISIYASKQDYRIQREENQPYKMAAKSRMRISDAREVVDTRTRKNVYDVFYATNRDPIVERDELVGFGAEDAGAVRYGVAEVLIPDGHRIGSIGSPLWRRLLNRKDDRLRQERLIALSDELFWMFIRETAGRMPSRAHPTIFIHGFNTPFEQAVLRAAQIGHDLGIGQGVGLFSWPSKGSFFRYAADEASVESSKYLLAEFLTEFIEKSPTGRVNVIAHSMGCRCLIGALEKIASSDHKVLTGLNQVILAAADVDNKVMPYQCKPVVKNCHRVTSYVSDLDQALQFSGWLHNFPRVGITPPTFVLDGIDTIVVNDMSLGDFKHGYVSSSRTVLSDMFALLKHGQSPSDRHSIEAISDGFGDYWRMKK